MRYKNGTCTKERKKNQKKKKNILCAKAVMTEIPCANIKKNQKVTSIARGCKLLQEQKASCGIVGKGHIIKNMEARIEELKDNGHAPTSQYDFLAGKVQNMEFDNFKITLTHEIEKTHTHIDAVEGRLNARIETVEERLNARIDIVTEQIKSTNTRIDALDEKLTEQIKSTNTRIDATNTRIDDMKTIVDKTDKRISNMLVVFGIAFAGLFAVLGVILSKLG